jgi:hypothetical protein
MPFSDDYRRFAAECRDQAEKTLDFQEKTRLGRVAQAWLDMAAEKEKESARTACHSSVS